MGVSGFKILPIRVAILVSALALSLSAHSNAAPQTSTLIHTLENPGGILSVSFSPSGQVLACGGEHTLRLFDVESGALLHSFKGQKTSVNSVAFSPDGALLASGDDDGIIRIWDVLTGELKRTITAHHKHETNSSHDYRVLSVRFSPDGKVLASGSGGFECHECKLYGEVKLWNVHTGELVSDFLERHYIFAMAFSPDGNTLATDGGEDTIEICDLRTTSLQRSLKGHSAKVTSLAFSPSGTFLFSGSKDKTVKMWDTQTWNAKQTFNGHKAQILSIAIYNQDKIVGIGDKDTTIRLWDMNTRAMHSIPISHQGFMNSVAVSPDSNVIAVGVADGTLMVWKMR